MEKVTDNEIIKALEICIDFVSGGEAMCKNCPLYDCNNCSSEQRKQALDLIKRLQERIKKLENIERFATKTIEKQEKEIEKLNVELVGMRGACESYKIHYDIAQAEIERLRAKLEAKNNDWLIKGISKGELELERKEVVRENAIKEFVKKFEKKIKDVKFTIGQTWEIQCALKQTLKEMTEGSE